VLGDLQIIRGMLVATFDLEDNYRMDREMGGVVSGMSGVTPSVTRV